MRTGGGRVRRRGAAATPCRSAALLVATVLAVLALLAACTADDGDDGAPTSTTSVGGTGQPVDGGRLRIGLAGPAVIDPAEASPASASELMVLDLLHDGLARLNAEGTPQPALAASWTPSSDRATWEFALDPAATFSDGEPVTASDVVASLEHVAAAGDSSLAALRLEQVQGFRAFVDGAAEHLAGLTAPDARTVRIALDGPMSVLPQLLASPVFGIVDVDSVTAATDGALDELRLTGSWTVDEAGEEGSLVVTRRSEHPGHLAEVELVSFDDAGAAYDAFDAGALDWAPVPAERFGTAVDTYGDDHFAPFHAQLYFGMNVRSPALADVELRRAIAAAIDRHAIVRAVYADLADPLTTIIPAGVAGHEVGRCDGCGYDPERARELVDEAFPDGDVPEVHVDFDDSPAQEAMAEIVVEGLEAVGIPATLRPLPLEDYKRFVVSGDQELFSFGWIGVYTSPDAYLAPQFVSRAADNLTGLADPGIDELLASARAGAAPDGRFDTWGQVEAEILDAAIVVPIAQFRTQVVVAERVEGLAHAVDGTVDWRAVWLTDGG